MVDGGLVCYHGLVYVPDNTKVKRWLLQLYHDSIPAGHPGISNTTAGTELLLAENVRVCYKICGRVRDLPEIEALLSASHG